jgi:hypothetical protein
MLTDAQIWQSRDEMMKQMDLLDKKEATLNVDRLKNLKELALQQMKTAREEGQSSFTADGDPSKKDKEDKSLFIDVSSEISQLEKFIEMLEKAGRDHELSQMDANDREIAMITDKYAKMIEEATGFIDTEEFIVLRDMEITEMMAAQDKKYALDRAEAIKKIQEYGYDEKEKELQANIDQYDALLALAEEFGLDMTAILEAHKKSEKAIEDKYAKEDKAKSDEKIKREKDEQLEAAIGTITVASNTFATIGTLLGEQSEGYRAFAVFQGLLDTAGAALAAYKSAAEIPIVGPVLAPIAAASATVFGLLQVKKLRETQMSGNPSYETGGVARGAKHKNGGISMIDSKTGNKVGEMEGGEPYMILSGKTYQNNKGLIDTLLHNSMFKDGASVQWASAASIPQPDFSRLSQASKSYSYGGVTNINNYSGEKRSSVNANANTDVLLQNILLQLQRDEYKHAVIDQDNILSLRKAMKQFDRIEGRARG